MKSCNKLHSEREVAKRETKEEDTEYRSRYTNAHRPLGLPRKEDDDEYLKI